MEEEQTLQIIRNLQNGTNTDDTQDLINDLSGLTLRRVTNFRDARKQQVLAALAGRRGPEPLQNMQRFLRTPATIAEREDSIFSGLMWKERGNDLYRRELYSAARDAYLNAIRLILFKAQTYNPIETVGTDTAVSRLLRQNFLPEFVDLVACVNNIAQTYMKEETHVATLEWTVEATRMYDAEDLAGTGPHFKWELTEEAYENLMTEPKMRTFIKQAIVFEKLGNSAGAACAAQKVFQLSEGITTPSVLNLRRQIDTERTFMRRHPDPADIFQISYQSSELQVRGIWTKLRFGRGDGTPPSRKGFSSCIWNGTYFVFGGFNGSFRFLSDGWALNLDNPERGWRKLPSPPIELDSLHGSYPIAVHGNKAYLFQGRPNVPVFDLPTETWSTIQTSIKGGENWTAVFPGSRLRDYAFAVSEDTIFYFGGTDRRTALGRNALVSLDLTTRKWEIAAGTVEQNCNPEHPGLRMKPVMWIDQGKLWVTLGHAGRMTDSGSFFSADVVQDYPYQDIWSYDIKKKAWTEERYNGNSPCMRAEVAYTFNRAWNRAITYGGSTALLPFPDSSIADGIDETYFGDTFAWSPVAKRWSQVITRSFPTYRAGGDLFTNPETGRTYLFGGCTGTFHTPSHRDASGESFSDVWELSIDVPGSSFKESEFELDPRFARLGPFKTCFTCRRVGRWMTCGGTCKHTDQVAKFCGTDCLHEGWDEHKALNGCRKT